MKTLLLHAAWIVAATGTASANDILEAGRNNEPYRAAIYRSGIETVGESEEPVLLRPGPHLLIDDFLISTTDHVTRRVNSPVRDSRIPNPLVDGKDDWNYQPYTSVLRDETTGRFRIWYNARRDGRSRIATMESEDGIHWQRPPRILEDPGPIKFGCCVIDEGSAFHDRSARYKFAWWMEEIDNVMGGLRVAASPDGLDWKAMTPGVVLRHNHDINNIFWDPLRKLYVATLSYMSQSGPTWTSRRRVTMQSTSSDLVHWDIPRYILTPDDESDPPETQFYAMQGHIIRGDLWIGLVKVLHDNWQAKGTPDGSFGMGHTQLAWTRDGETWVRDQTPFFEPDPTPGAWDHAHAWMDCQVPVGDQVYIYYAGYKNGHKVKPYEERQIGMVRMLRDRYVSRDAGPEGGTLITRPVVSGDVKMTVNARINGDLCVRLLDRDGKAIPGFEATVHGDGVALPVEWKQSLDNVKNKPVRIEFMMQDAQLYGFTLEESSHVREM